MVDNGRPVKHVNVGVKFGVGVVVVLVSLFACNLAKAVSSTPLEWNPNTDPSVAGYNVYYGGTSRTYTNVINAGNSTLDTIRRCKKTGCKASPRLLFQYLFTAGSSKKYCC